MISLEFFNIVNFVLGYSPSLPSEVALRERFAKIGIEGGKTFDPTKLSPEMKAAIEQGRAERSICHVYAPVLTKGSSAGWLLEGSRTY